VKLRIDQLKPHVEARPSSNSSSFFFTSTTSLQ
jgi:hypothetical protein